MHAPDAPRGRRSGAPRPGRRTAVAATAAAAALLLPGGAAYQDRPENLASYGYVEQEYIVRGKADVYEWPNVGPAVVRTADAPYVTRILVRKPARASRFSGNVVVEPLNPSNLFDLNIG